MQSEPSYTQSHTNNFDFLRILFATLVLITHSYALTGLPEEDILWKFSHGQTVLSQFAVFSFFTISGYLIFKSLLRSQVLKDYYFKRIIRVFPALWLVIFITVIGGYFLANKNLAAYLTDSSVPRYFLNLILRIRGGINGVFEHNAYPKTINGSLWTIPYEVLWYILLTPFFFIRKRLTLLRVAVITLFIVMLAARTAGLTRYFIHKIDIDVESTALLGLYFVGGAILSLFSQYLRDPRVRAVLVVSAGIGLAITLHWGGFSLLQYFLIPLFVIPFGLSNYTITSWVRKYGDISYGVYIWGFPIQQTIWYFLRPSQPVMVLLSIPITWLFGFVSWHLLESKVLQLKLKLPATKID